MHNSKIDNTKGLLIILVIFGHVLSRNNLDSVNYFIYVMIYTFHMPLMFIISGYLSSSTLKRSFKENFILNFKKMIIPFIIVSFAYILLSHNLLGYKMRTDIFYRPPFALWYLIALFFYRIFIKYFMKIKYNLLLALFIWCIATYGPASTFNHYSLYRIFSFQLYFVIGIYLKLYVDKDKLNFPKKKLIMMTCIVITINLVIYHFAGRHVDEFYKLYQYSGKVLSMKYIYPGLKVLSLMASLLSSIVIWNLMSKNKTVLTKIGNNSMSYYLFHILLIVIYQSYIFPKFTNISNPIYGLIINVILTISIVILSTIYSNGKMKIKGRIKTT